MKSLLIAGEVGAVAVDVVEAITLRAPNITAEEAFRQAGYGIGIAAVVAQVNLPGEEARLRNVAALTAGIQAGSEFAAGELNEQIIQMMGGRQ